MRIFVRRTVGDGGGIEDHDVGLHSRLENSAIGDVNPRRRLRGHLPDCFFEGKKLFVSHVMSQYTRKAPVSTWMRAGVPQDSDDRAGIGPDRHPRLLHGVFEVLFVQREVNRCGCSLCRLEEAERSLDRWNSHLGCDLIEALSLEVREAT